MHPLVYCVNARPWLRELSQSHDAPLTLLNVPEPQVAQWARLGFTHIWLLGVWSSGPLAREAALRGNYQRILPDGTTADVQGSPFAIADYAVSADLGGDAALARFREQLRRNGLKLMLDFVPNHLGLDHAWVRQRPGLFVRTSPGASGSFAVDTASGKVWLAHGRDPFFPPWNDTVQLDYRVSATREAMSGLLLSVSERCDAVRCDMAMLILNSVFADTWGSVAGPPTDAASSGEFWAEAIQSVKRRFPEFTFLAEVYWGLETNLRALGFDYAYDKSLYDKLIASDFKGAREHIYQLSPDALAGSAHFLENHDEARVAGVLPLPAHRAAAVLTLSLPGLRLLHDGQLTGARVRLPVQLARRPPEAIDSAIQEVYETLLLTLRETAVGQGTAELLTPLPPDAGTEAANAEACVLLRWQNRRNTVDLVAVNLDTRPARCQIPVATLVPAARSWEIEDLFTGRKSSQDRSHPLLPLDIPPFAAEILRFRAI